MRERIESALQPQVFDLIDESHKHIGHEGARDGRGHYKVRIVSVAFTGKAPLARHRLVYEALGDMMQTDIHALSIEARTPDEA
ncbi:BolA family protein [Tahibacter amnicola]|uniref:BolA family transcriptional regulator n=1 Tax=Tahibacter amnicola TaxID=2976241 RepID=A0ABY6BMJ0_9GAMM|nr:BolA family protein [Tahibacter amnicola]UXI70702.1 BolA family transcriptional regulator [Tahibacter amnicola]